VCEESKGGKTVERNNDVTRNDGEMEESFKGRG